MMDTVIFAVIAVLLLVLLLTVARQRRKNPNLASLPPIEELFPRHAWYFPQIRQALSKKDLQYLAARASPECRRRVQCERQQIVRQYLQGLRKDFDDLEQLGRTVAALSPRVSGRTEFERLVLSLRFRFLTQLVSMRMALGANYARSLEELAEMVANLASQMDELLESLENVSAQAQEMSSGPNR